MLLLENRWSDRYNGQIWFWAGQGLNLLTAVLLILGLLEIWFDK